MDAAMDSLEELALTIDSYYPYHSMSSPTQNLSTFTKLTHLTIDTSYFYACGDPNIVSRFTNYPCTSKISCAVDRAASCPSLIQLLPGCLETLQEIVLHVRLLHNGYLCLESLLTGLEYNKKAESKLVGRNNCTS